MSHYEYAFCPSYSKQFQDTFMDVMSGSKTDYTVGMATLNSEFDHSVFFVLTTMSHSYFDIPLDEYIRNEVQRLYNLLGTTDDVVEGLKSIVLDKAMNDVRTLTHFNAIKECLKNEAPPEYDTVHLMVKDPWLIVSDSLQCSQEEMNELVFKQMIEISRPEELMESFGLVEGAELTDEKIAQVIANTISTSIYIYIVKSIYYQIQNSNVFRHVINEADHFDEYFVNKLSQVTLATGEQLVRDLFSEAS